MPNSTVSQNPTILKKAPHLLMQVFKSLNVSEELAVWIGAMVLQTNEQMADMAIWLYRKKETNPKTILMKAQEIAQISAS